MIETYSSTASFVSSQGLVVTNHHCAAGAFQLNSTAENNLLEKGFNAATTADEVSAGPNARIFVLDDITDVTDRVKAAIAAAPGPLERTRAVEDLEGDVMNGLERYHEMTAILDKVAAAELLGRRQDMAANQLLSLALEQMLARSKRLRDTEASTMNMQLVTWRDGRAANDALVRGTGDALRTWRQP